MLMNLNTWSWHYIGIEDEDIKIHNSSFERWKILNIWKQPLGNEILFKKTVRSHLVRKLLSSGLLPNNIKIKKYGTIILSFVLYECQSWTLTLR